MPKSMSKKYWKMKQQKASWKLGLIRTTCFLEAFCFDNVPKGKTWKSFRIQNHSKSMPKSMAQNIVKWCQNGPEIIETLIPHRWEINDKSKQFQNLRILDFCKETCMNMILSLNGRSKHWLKNNPKIMQTRCSKKQCPNEATTHTHTTLCNNVHKWNHNPWNTT